MADRRAFLKALAAAGILTSPLARAQLLAAPRFANDPFTLGIASGYPMPNSVVLWTRLAPVPAAPGGGLGPETIPVRWEVARDEAMRSIVASGTTYAEAAWAHSVHVEPEGLEPARWYWYRFTAGDAVSPVGRTRTAPGPRTRAERMRFAFASCQHYEQGFFGAYRHMLADELDLIVFLGDYIYESSWGERPVRKHAAPEPHTLDDYRARYALYKGDPDLREVHAGLPWVSTWDDHEVENDYAADRSEHNDPPEWFLARRAGAYKAYYEHMPLPRTMLPFGAHLRLHTRINYGSLASFFVLDDRQYRAPQACARAGRGGSTTVDVASCAELADPRRSLLGAEQEQWLDAGLAATRARWTILAQQTTIAQFDQLPGEGRRAWTDGWDGYPAARARLFDSLLRHRTPNPIAIGGDVHMFYVNELKRDFDDPRSPILASEFVGTSITSQSWPQSQVEKFLPDNPHVKLADARHRGYTRMELNAKRCLVELRAMDNVETRDAACRTLASFVVDEGTPGPQRV
jgi:alkaline phosphatase D